jgi:hypothetical protein
MRQLMMTVMALAVFGVTVITAQAETPSPGQVSHQSSGYSDWTTAADYQKLFNAMVQQHQYPRVVEAKVFDGVVLYHGAFQPYPAGCPGLGCTWTFWSHHGITPNLFARRDEQLRAQGFRLVHKQSVHLGEREFVQATWIGTAVTLSAAPSTCSGMELVCRSNRECNSGGRARICGGRFCAWELKQCMASGWWQGSLISRQVERR